MQDVAEHHAATPNDGRAGWPEIERESSIMALVLRRIPDRNDDEALARLSLQEPQWQFELDADGSLVVSPTYTDGGSRELEAGLQLHAFAKRVGGKTFGSSTGFRLADNSVRSPDASWISQQRIDRLRVEDRTKFWRVCPDVVVEILSDTDVWERLLEKLDLYHRNGAVYAVGIDPFERRVATRGTTPLGLVLDTDAIMDA